MFNHTNSFGVIKPKTLLLYEFDNSNLKDSSKGGFTGGILGGPLVYRESTKQGAKELSNLTAGQITITDTALLNQLTSLQTWTLEFWADIPSVFANSYILSVANAISVEMGCVLFDGGPDSYWGRSSAGGLGLQYTDTAPSLIGTGRHHYAFVVNGSASRKLYVDNILVASDAGDASFSGIPPTIFNIGKFWNVATQCNAAIDQYRFSTIARPGPFPTVD